MCICIAISGCGKSSRGRLMTLGALCVAAAGCMAADRPAAPTSSGRFESDVAFLREHAEVLTLTDPSGARVALSPTYQGRVMTSTTGGGDRPSFGWIGRSAID